MTQCTKCKQIKAKSEFHKDKTSKTGLHSHCKECVKLKSKKFRLTKKTVFEESQRKARNERITLVESLKTPCVKCGESRSYLIQFHHRDPEQKLFDVPQISSHGKNAIKAEATKCVCLCANCHIEFHHFFGIKPVNPVEALDEYLNDIRY